MIRMTVEKSVGERYPYTQRLSMPNVFMRYDRKLSPSPISDEEDDVRIDHEPDHDVSLSRLYSLVQRI